MFLDHEQFPTLPGHHPPALPAISTLYEQGSGSFNEDVLIEADPLFGVFDGATSLDGKRYLDGRTGGRLAAEIAAEVFKTTSGSLFERAEQANKQIAKALRDQGIESDERHRYWSSSLAVVKIEDNQLHFCQTGDAHILLIDDEANPRLVTKEIDIDSETLSLWKNMDVPPGSSIHELLASQIRKVRLQMNRTYGVLNGEPEAMDFIHHGTVSLNNIRHILLFTDGLLLPQSQPQMRQDWRAMSELYAKGGLSAIHKRVRTLQQSDPECRLYPRFKCHDDIAAIALDLSHSPQFDLRPERALA